jgi:hypothetical protein
MVSHRYGSYCENEGEKSVGKSWDMTRTGKALSAEDALQVSAVTPDQGYWGALRSWYLQSVGLEAMVGSL